MSEKIGASSKEDAVNGSVMTVLGPIDADDMGLTLVHEHLILEGRPYHLRDRSLTGESPSGLGGNVGLENLGILHRNPFYLEDNVVLDDVATMEKEVLAFKEAGGKTIVDQTSTKERRSPSKLVQLAQLTGVNVVMGCGYHRSPSHPPSLAKKSVEQIVEELVVEVRDGVGGDGPRAGIIGELGVSAPMGPGEEKVLMAGIRAQRETNLAMSVHVHPWGTETPMGYEVVRILDREGADLSRVILSHLDQCLNVEYHEDMLRTGVNIAYDHFGKEFHRDATHIQMPTDLQRLEALAELISRGYIDQLLISHDVCFKMHLRRYGRWGYAHILEHIVPLAQEIVGISERETEILLVDNPKRVLAG
jgi:phosphotriesterase-related protein